MISFIVLEVLWYLAIKGNPSLWDDRGYSTLKIVACFVRNV